MRFHNHLALISSLFLDIIMDPPFVRYDLKLMLILDSCIRNSLGALLILMKRASDMFLGHALPLANAVPLKNVLIGRTDVR